MATARAIPEPVKVAIVQALACFDTPTTVAASIKADWDMVISPQAIEAHDPTKRAGRNLAQRWRTLFEQTRAKFIEDTSSIPIAHRSARLRTLQRMATRAEAMNNIAMTSKLLEQAAREMGNAFTNKVDHQSTDGTMSPPTLADFYGALAKAAEPAK